MNNLPARQPGSHESGLMQRVRKSLQSIPLDRPQVLLACSGGKDSVALACILTDLARVGCLTLTLGHIHHGQHERANEAARAVESIGGTLGVPVIVRQLSLESIAAHVGVGLEEALRRERYLALAAIARELDATCIALAHHQTDQTETVLLHLLRGSGVDGLAGMREWEIRDIPWWRGPVASTIGLWRPLLHEAARDVATIATRSGLPIVADPTNDDTSFRRNAVRHDVLPMLERISPGSTAAIARSGEVVATDAALLRDATEDHFATCRMRDGINRAALVALPDGWQQRVIRTWLIRSDVSVDLTHDRIAAVSAMARRNRGGSRVQLGDGYDVVLTRGVLSIEAWQNREQ